MQLPLLSSQLLSPHDESLYWIYVMMLLMMKERRKKSHSFRACPICTNSVMPTAREKAQLAFIGKVSRCDLKTNRQQMQ